MKTRIPLIVLSLFGLAAFSAAQDTETARLVTWLCTSALAQDPQTQQASKIQVGSATREDVASLLGKPWRTNNDADCDATQYDAVWEYLFEDANRTFFRVHVAFDKDGKVSLVARIPQRGKTVVLAYAAGKEHQH
jgi:outer membrane protein assembly factor BamE (lipoprotein component of BamABCDE complex)